MESNAYQAVDALLASHSVKVRFGGNHAFYDSRLDFIGMPQKAAHDACEAYYSTLLHELTHWTGHLTRLDRSGIADAGSTELEAYAYEELIAEIGSAFLCAEFGVRGEMRHEGYVLSWIEALENDSKAIFTSSAAAWKARCYLLGEDA